MRTVRDPQLHYCAPLKKKHRNKKALGWIPALVLAAVLCGGLLVWAAADTLRAVRGPQDPESFEASSGTTSGIPAHSPEPGGASDVCSEDEPEYPPLPSGSSEFAPAHSGDSESELDSGTDPDSGDSSESSESRESGDVTSASSALSSEGTSDTASSGEASDTSSGQSEEPAYIYESYFKPIPFETEYIDTDDLPEGETAVKREGVDGSMKYSVKRLYDGDKIIYEDVWSVDVAQKPVNAILLRGTRRDITYETYSYEKEVPFQTVYEDTEELPVGEEQLKQEGVTGRVKYTVKQTYVNGKLKDEDVISVDTLVEMKNRIIRRGVSHTFRAPDGSVYAYSKAVEVVTTCYYRGEEGGNHSATGKTLEYGMIAVDPKVIPLGSKLYIDFPGSAYDGIFYAEDTGGAIKNNKIDVFFESQAAAKAFQKIGNYATVYILG